MSDVEHLVIEQLQLQQIPDLNRLGGLETVYSQLKAFTGSKLLDEILSAVIAGTSGEEAQENKYVVSMFIQGFKDNLDPIPLKETIHLLCRNAERLKGCFQTLLLLASDRNRLGILRRYYLLGAFEIALVDNAKKHALIGYLLEIDKEEDLYFLSHALKIIGVSYTLFGENDLFDKLQAITAEVNDQEGFYEMGMGWMYRALNAEDQTKALDYFDKARTFFKHLDFAEREDARCYTLTLDLLHGFTTDGSGQVLKALFEELRVCILANTAYNYSNNSISWKGLRNIELLNWKTLSYKLSEFFDSMNEPTWFEPVMVIEEYLLQIYFSNRSILRKEEGKGIDHLIQPVIQQKFSDQASQVYLLDQWLKKHTGHKMWPEGNQIKEEIERYKSNWIRGNDEGTTETLEAVVPSYKLLPVSQKRNFESFMEEYRLRSLNSVSKDIIFVFNDLTEKLGKVKDFHDGEVGQNFKIILYHTLCFLQQRMDATKANNRTLSYLFKKKILPLEFALQDDYYQFMSVNPMGCEVTKEQMDIGGGRVDVFFNYGSHRFCAEIKRELKDSSFKNIKQQYLGQTLEYQNTSAKLGLLLVLDLVEKPYGIGSLKSNVMAEVNRRNSEDDMRGAIIVRVPANRITPSRIKIAN